MSSDLGTQDDALVALRGWATDIQSAADSLKPLSEKRVWGDDKRGVYEMTWAWKNSSDPTKYASSYTFKRNSTLGAGTWAAGSVSALNIIRDESGKGAPRFLLVGQHRGPIQMPTLELPGGKMDPGESPLQAGLRENSEETGLPMERDASGRISGNGYTLVSHSVSKLPYSTDSGIGGAGSQLVVLNWEKEGTLRSGQDLPKRSDLSPGEIARKLTCFVPTVSGLPRFLDQAEESGVVLNSTFALVRPLMAMLSSGI